MCAFPLPQRRKLRLSGYDYAGAGAYFVTVCLRGRRGLLGTVEGGKVCLTEAGRMIDAEWLALPARFEGLELDQYVVMPDHLHGLLLLESAAGRSLGEVMGAFKSITTLRYTQGVREHGWPAFDRHLWQRSYYEHVVRNEVSLHDIRAYVLTNPLRWSARTNLAVGP